jgi:hypothetical protein
LYAVGGDGFEYCLVNEDFLLVDSYDLRPSNQCIFVTVIPNYLRFLKMCLCQVSLLSRCTSLLGGVEPCLSGLGTRFSTYGECDVNGFRLIDFNSPFYEPILYC